MFRPIASSVRQPAPRRGALLIAVLGLLTLFAIFALFFVFYADAEATSSRIHREAQSPGDDTLDGAPAFNSTLASIIFDDSDTTSTGILNPLRGHSLARSMYGGQQGLSAPFSGIGTFHEIAPHGQDRATWINYSAPYTIPSGPQAGTYFLDPEWTQFRLASELGTSPGSPPRSQSYIPKNAPYTYPDLKDLILASVSPATGEVLVPSLHRNWLFNANNPNVQYRLAPWNPSDTAPGTNTAMNTDWVTPEGRTRILRPRPIDQLKSTDYSAYGATYPVPANLPPNLAGYATPNQLYTMINAKIASGEIIGYPKPNADGTYTGDVQNLTGGVGVQKNDSILVDIGLPPKLWNGRWIKPLASILLTDLDGRVNLNVSGNTRNGGTHASFAGYGPHEVNLARVFDLSLSNATLVGEANTVVNIRNGGNTARNGTATLAYDRSNVRLPQYSLVNFDASGTPGNPAIVMPGFANNTPFQTSPTYGGSGFFDDNTTAGKYQNHPLLFNPNEWGPSTSATGARTFPLADLKRFNLRYAANPEWYAQTNLARNNLAPTSLLSATSRTDLAHTRRGVLTTLSTNFDRPGLVGNFGTGVLQLNAGLHPTIAPSQQFTGAGSDFAGAQDFRNPRAALGPVDLNRPLTDYRDNPAQPLSPTNMTNSRQAWADRHNLARDIFARLIVATGASATVFTAVTPVGMTTYQPGDIVINAAAGTPEYNALRYLAQLAANAVDMIDNDDVSTAFVWNPNLGAGSSGLTLVDALNGPTDVQNLMAASAPNQTEIQNRIVFGVEKPRLVINEAYGEITNQPGEAFMGNATQPARVRFWVELLNPTTTPYTGATPGPLGDGSVALRTGGFSPYQIAITQVTPANQNDLSNPANTTGDIALAMQGSLTFDFSTAAAGRTVLPVGATPLPASPYAPPNGNPGFVLVGPQSYNGGTPHMVGGAPVEFVPNTGAAPWNGMIAGNAFGAGSTMEYALGSMPAATDLENPMFMQPFRQHAVLLRRLANPYLQPNPPPGGPLNPALPFNPYITVDVMNYVPAYDAVTRGAGDTADRTGKGAGATTSTAGFEDITNRYSVGKVQPYAGSAALGGPINNNVTEISAFPQSMVIRQNPNPANPSEPQHTFFRMNGRNALPPAGPAPTYTAAGMVNNETIMAPFDWFVHFDRAIVNPLELFSLQAVKPHQVTQYFIQPPTAAGSPLRRGAGQVPWFGVTPAGQPNSGFPNFDANGLPTFDTASALTNNGLYRALDVLRVKPWMYGSALGGKVHGKININTIQDPRVLWALLDPQNGNAFADVIYDPSTPNDPTTVWGRLMASRTSSLQTRQLADGTNWAVPVAGPTIDDLGSAGNDRPFKTFGAAEYASGSPQAMNAGSGLQDTMLRFDTRPGQPTTGYPLAWAPTASTHSHLQSEMIRKIMNNTTTTSNAFAVTITIVFHEVRMNGTSMEVLNEGAGNRYLIGREAFKDAPGDLRQQFFAVVDRTNIGFVPVASGTPTVRQPQPFFGALDRPPVVSAAGTDLYLENGGNGTFYADGRPFILSAGAMIVVGVGANQETVQVQSVDPTTGFIRVAGLTLPHAAGELVSNTVLGNPGPVNPSTFDPLSPNSPYTAVVPFAQRVR